MGTLGTPLTTHLNTRLEHSIEQTTATMLKFALLVLVICLTVANAELMDDVKRRALDKRAAIGGRFWGPETGDRPYRFWGPETGDRPYRYLSGSSRTGYTRE